jgi:hypothetical protein
VHSRKVRNNANAGELQAEILTFCDMVILRQFSSAISGGLSPVQVNPDAI